MADRPKQTVGAVVLAAGRSKRFRSSVPKVLHASAGRPLALWVLETLRELHRTTKLGRVVLVVPPGGAVEEALERARFPFKLAFAVQDVPRGTGDAVHVGLDALGRADEVLVLAGDGPLVRPDSLRTLVRTRRRTGAAVALLTAVVDDPGAYGRIVRDERGRVTAIVEAKDLADDQRGIDEINASIYAFDRRALADALPRLDTDNAQGELLLTDAVAMLSRDGTAAVEGHPQEVLGANTRREFEEVSALLRRRVLDRLMDAGVSIVHPDSTFVDADVKVGQDTVLLPGVFLEGATSIGRGCEIGPNVRLVDTTVGEGSRVTFAVARRTKIGARCEVGPFASLRDGTVLRTGAKAGTFVETKAAEIGEGSKVPHLSYMGDVRIGRRTNVGAGTITCNYDPFKQAPDGGTKHRTEIGDDVFVGSDTMLVAPVRLARGARTGAGSVVNRDVPPDTVVYGVPARPRPAEERKTKKAAKRSEKGRR
ncbi:MAG TPA: bifunctional UDP-N-acetylglucosamine diphosphorylase/glucosamine-1-phosphate N-acetyltransferase GlmU [Actinomycetota bacterium]|nr:bifunctional UDP-N-acetylglucosamine diphosphorylase/glucosamine-1-phosphate N-acetyltransferase GlmU [Actinomycetota bacterium]